MGASKEARFQRRAAERAWQRQALAGVDPHADARTRQRCSIPGCPRSGPDVVLGEVRLTLCATHKRALDRGWTRRAGHHPAA